MTTRFLKIIFTATVLVMMACSNHAGFGSSRPTLFSSFMPVYETESAPNTDADVDSILSFTDAKKLSLEEFFQNVLNYSSNEDLEIRGFRFCSPHDYLLNHEQHLRKVANQFSTLGDYFEYFGILSETDLDEEKALQGYDLASQATCQSPSLDDRKNKDDWEFEGGMSLLDANAPSSTAEHVGAILGGYNPAMAGQTEQRPIPRNQGTNDLQAMAAANQVADAAAVSAANAAQAVTSPSPPPPTIPSHEFPHTSPANPPPRGDPSDLR